MSLSIALKVAPKALRVLFALRERAGVRETTRATATIISQGGADAMGVSPESRLMRLTRC